MAPALWWTQGKSMCVGHPGTPEQKQQDHSLEWGYTFSTFSDVWAICNLNEGLIYLQAPGFSILSEQKSCRAIWFQEKHSSVEGLVLVETHCITDCVSPSSFLKHPVTAEWRQVSQLPHNNGTEGAGYKKLVRVQKLNQTWNMVWLW